VRCMGQLMCDADLAIGAAGSTSWERCCLGLPTLQLVLAENQGPIANALTNAGAAHLLDPFELSSSLSTAMDQLMEDSGLLLRMSIAASRVVDGRGADRVVHYLEKGL
jgi:UDP-2,4-diacetamido-2,4,6-trideoxy-beta-L-altropyranose hydrolase